VVTDSVQIYSGNICTNLSENDLKNSEIYTQAKLEAVTELFKEGLSVEQIARALQLSVERVKAQIDQ
jgi:DNA-binding NarL/FixJ family response regulator